MGVLQTQHPNVHPFTSLSSFESRFVSEITDGKERHNSFSPVPLTATLWRKRKTPVFVPVRAIRV